MAITRNGGGAVVSATTARQGVVQLTDSTSSTSTSTAATPNAVKSAYDLANAAVAKSVITTAGDLIVGTGSATIARLAIGSSGTRLTSNGTTATWVADSTNTVVDAAGDLLVGTASDTLGRVAIGTNGQVLKSNGTTVEWGSAADATKIPLSTVTAAGDLILGTGSSTVTNLAIGTANYVLTSNGTTATWAAAAGGTTVNDANLAFGLQVYG